MITHGIPHSAAEEGKKSHAGPKVVLYRNRDSDSHVPGEDWESSKHFKTHFARPPQS